ncbi:glycosyltransferase family 4 protein [Streptomyces sp. NPDC005322]|uniref:glycosyltransferase family 4 protein n=1 Tax=Streptomyces sp. NPDC005322 TaxID=3157032 RepID=UPI0033AEADD5
MQFDLTAGSTRAVANGDAAQFYGSLCRHQIDYDAAFTAYEQGLDPMMIDSPIHPSYEDKDGVPDRSFGRVGPKATRHLESYWAGRLRAFGFDRADVIHLNHLTPIQSAATEAAPGIPIVATMHGTEIKFWQSLMAVDSGDRRALDHAGFWRQAMARYASLCDRIVAISSSDVVTLTDELKVDPSRVRYIPHGVDTVRFRPVELAPQQDEALWTRLLVDDCAAAEPGRERGTIRYTRTQLTHLSPGRREETVRLMWLGRFLTQKRLNQLLRVFGRVTSRMSDCVSLVVWGGFPGEHEGVHPFELACELGVDDRVYFCGWRGHDDLAEALPTVDALVVPAVNESFGLMYLEAMASGVPVLATRTGGPVDFVVDHGESANGWLVPPDDDAALEARLVEIIRGGAERRRRGANALRRAVDGFSWHSVAQRYRDLFAEARAEGGRRHASPGVRLEPSDDRAVPDAPGATTQGVLP